MKVLIRHHSLRDYRVPFFEILSNKYDVYFVWGNNHNFKNKFEAQERIIGYDIRWTDIKSIIRNISYLLRIEHKIFVTSVPLEKTSVIGLISSKILNKKTVLWEEGWSYPFKKGLKWKFALFFYKYFLIHFIDSYFIGSTKTLFFMNYLNIKKDKIYFHSQCSLDISKIKNYSNPILKKHLQFSWPHKKVVLYLSRIIELKGLDVLIKAFSMLEKQKDDYFLMVAGDGPYRPFCERLARKLKLRNYQFIGEVRDDRLKATLYKKSDIFVLPTSLTEGWGLVINEALSCSLPVVVTDGVGCCEDLVFNGQNGFVVPRSNSEAMAYAIDRILGDDKLRNSMKLRSRQIFSEKNDYQKMSDTFIQAVEYASKN